MRLITRAVVAPLCCGLVFAFAGAPPAAADAAAARLTGIPVSTLAAFVDLIAGPDGNFWSIRESGTGPDSIEKITPSGDVTLYLTPNANGTPAIAAGSDGNVWYATTVRDEAFNGTPEIVRITSSGDQTQFPLPAGDKTPTGLLAGPDGQMWFAAPGGVIGELSATGAVTQYSVPDSDGSGAMLLTLGSDGAIWFTQELPTGSAVGKITTVGDVTRYPLPSGDSGVSGITPGPDGNVWFTEQNSSYGTSLLADVTPSGQLAYHPLPAGTHYGQLTAGPDGNLWITASFDDRLPNAIHGALAMVDTASDQLALFQEPGPSYLTGVTVGPGGDIWYGDEYNNELMRVSLTTGSAASMTLFAYPSVSGQPSYVWARVEPTDPNNPSYPNGYIAFTVDGVPRAPQPIAPGSWLDTSALPPGEHTITARYLGDENYLGAAAAPLTLTITSPQTPTTTALSLLPDPAVAYVGDRVSLTATVSPAAAGTVQFYDGPSPLGTPVTVNGAGIAGYETTDLRAGPHEFSAVFTSADPAFAGSTSPTRPMSIYELNFGIDRYITAQGNSEITTTPFSTTDPPGARLLVAFTSSDGPKARQSTTVSGAGLTWTLAERANSKGGTAEIWTAYTAGPLLQATVTSTPKYPGYDQSLTVLAFTRANGVGAGATASKSGGAPTVSLTTTQQGSQVFAVGEDYNGAIGRAPGPGQNLLSQWIDTPPGETFWAQEGGITAQAGTRVTMNDTAPSGDTWNMAAVEVLPAP